jgi:hypothetical protein
MNQDLKRTPRVAADKLQSSTEAAECICHLHMHLISWHPGARPGLRGGVQWSSPDIADDWTAVDRT